MRQTTHEFFCYTLKLVSLTKLNNIELPYLHTKCKYLVSRSATKGAAFEDGRVITDATISD